MWNERLTDSLSHQRAVMISLIGFKAAVEQVMDFAGQNVRTSVHRAGEQLGRQTVLTRNKISFWEPVHALECWDDGVQRLVDRLGGWERIRELRVRFPPDDMWLQIDVPFYGTPYVESSVLEAQTVQKMAEAGLSLAVEAFDFDSEQPTHHPVESTAGHD